MKSKQLLRYDYVMWYYVHIAVWWRIGLWAVAYEGSCATAINRHD